MAHKYFDYKNLTSYDPIDFKIGKHGEGKKQALWKAQKLASMRNIRLNSTSLINDLQNLLDLYSKDHNERMYKKTMALLTSLNNFIVESYNKDPEEGK